MQYLLMAKTAVSCAEIKCHAMYGVVLLLKKEKKDAGENTVSLSVSPCSIIVWGGVRHYHGTE